MKQHIWFDKPTLLYGSAFTRVLVDPYSATTVRNNLSWW